MPKPVINSKLEFQAKAKFHFEVVLYHLQQMNPEDIPLELVSHHTKMLQATHAFGDAWLFIEESTDDT